MGEESVAEEEAVHNPLLKSLQGQILAGHCVRVCRVQQLAWVRDEGEHLSCTPLVCAQITPVIVLHVTFLLVLRQFSAVLPGVDC